MSVCAHEQNAPVGPNWRTSLAELALRNLYDSSAGSNFSATYDHRILVEMIPAETGPAGSQAVKNLQLLSVSDNNFEMQSSELAWPQETTS